jgi:hypothetical protein
MADEIRFVVERAVDPPLVGDDYDFAIYINGRSLIEATKSDHRGLPPSVGLRHFLGETNEDFAWPDRGVAVLRCTCGVAGCGDFVVCITVEDDRIIWTPYEGGGRRAATFASPAQLTFDRAQYEAALEAAGSE